MNANIEAGFYVDLVAKLRRNTYIRAYRAQAYRLVDHVGFPTSTTADGVNYTLERAWNDPDKEVIQRLLREEDERSQTIYLNPLHGTVLPREEQNPLRKDNKSRDRRVTSVINDYRAQPSSPTLQEAYSQSKSSRSPTKKTEIY